MAMPDCLRHMTRSLRGTGQISTEKRDMKPRIKHRCDLRVMARHVWVSVVCDRSVVKR
jgi:hypothetical protein